jgi:hypothetical protein
VVAAASIAAGEKLCPESFHYLVSGGRPPAVARQPAARRSAAAGGRRSIAARGRTVHAVICTRA